MPILPPTAASPLDVLNTILDAARFRLNDRIDTLQPIGGKLLQNNQAFSQQGVNNAWRRFQEKLANLGFTTLTDEAIIYGLPVAGSADPASQAYINWTNYFDGNNLLSAPVLPYNLIQPLKVWERQNGINSPFIEPPMEQILDGLPAFPKTALNRRWEWRNNSIYLPGALAVVDLRIKFITYFADFADLGGVRWFQQPVPIVRCQEPFSLYIAAEFENARGDKAAAKEFGDEAESATKALMNREVRSKQRVNVRRQPRGGYGGNGWGWE